MVQSGNRIELLGQSLHSNLCSAENSLPGKPIKPEITVLCHVTMDTRTRTELALPPLVKYMDVKENHIQPHNAPPSAYSGWLVL